MSLQPPASGQTRAPETGGHPHTLFILKRALDEDACQAVRRAMNAGTSEATEILEDEFVRRDEVRQAAHLEVDEDTRGFVEAQLDALRPRIARFFHTTLGDREGISLLRYGAGGFFKRHRDQGAVASWPDAARRRISVVLFLTTSRQLRETGTFSGGALRFFDDEGLLTHEVHPEAGTLVAFPSNTLHEVLPVADGTRDAVVDWFY